MRVCKRECVCMSGSGWIYPCVWLCVCVRVRVIVCLSWRSKDHFIYHFLRFYFPFPSHPICPPPPLACSESAFITVTRGVFLYTSLMSVVVVSRFPSFPTQLWIASAPLPDARELSRLKRGGGGQGQNADYHDMLLVVQANLQNRFSAKIILFLFLFRFFYVYFVIDF